MGSNGTCRAVAAAEGPGESLRGLRFSRTSGRMLGWACVCLVSLALSRDAAGETDFRILNGFNDEAECAAFRWGVKVELAEEHATEGKKAAKVMFPAGKRYAGFGIGKDLLARWGDYDHFAFDVFNPNEGNVDIVIRIDDDKSKPDDYSTQYCGTFRALPGANHFEIKTARIPNCVQPWLQRKLDPNKLALFALWLGAAPGRDTVLYFDNFQLRNNPKVELPKAMRAFDFGPADADCWGGFTPVSPRSQYSDEAGYGFTDTKGLAGLDDSFGEGIKSGEALCGSGVYRPGGPLAFTVKLAPGRYKLWGAAGMTIYPKRRYAVSCNGRQMFQCKPGDRLNDLDPVGRDYTTRSTIWETLIVGQLCDEFTAEVDVPGGPAEIRLEGEYASWLSGGLRALILYPAGDADAEKAFAEIQRQRKEKFLERWRELKPAGIPAPGEFTAEERSRGFLLAYRHYGEVITPWFVPKAADRLTKLSIAATPGEKEPAVFIVYPTKDAPKCEVQVGPLTGPAGVIPAAAVKVEYVHYRYLKGNGGFDVVPSHVVPLNHLAVEKGVPRQFWMTVTVPENAAPGKYVGTVTVSAGGGTAAFPLEIEVYPFTLDSVTECGLIYAHICGVPRDMDDFEAAVRCLVDHNCNSVTVGGVISIDQSQAKGGKLVFNFDRLDRAMEIMRKAGMAGPVPLFDMSVQGEGGGNSYSHLGFKRLPPPFNCKLTDPGYFDAMTELARQTNARAKAKDYLPVLMYPVTELSNDPNMGPPYLKKLVAAFRKAGDVTLISSLNTPQDIVCAKDLDHMMVNWGLKLTEERLAQIRRDGARLWFQNIGQSRYTEGFLMLKTGAIGRRQWAVNGGAGNDTQGGDPFNGFLGHGNSSLLFRTRDGAIPNVTLKRMSEGADDCRYAFKLLKLIAQAEAQGSDRARAAAAEARKAYDGILAAIRIDTGGGKIEIDGRCDSTGDFTDKSIYDQFRRTIAAHIIALTNAPAGRGNYGN